MTSMQRRREEGEIARVTPLELFYDLVFVFAITQVAHGLLEHLTWVGLGQSALALLVVWWAWNYTTWVTNELDPGSSAVRLLLIGLMLASLLLEGHGAAETPFVVHGSVEQRAHLLLGQRFQRQQ